MRRQLGTTFRSLRIRNYRLFFTGQLIKLIGVWTQIVAQDWLVLELSHDSGTALGLVTALQFLPVPLLTLYAGTLADRYDKRTLLYWANGLFAVATVVLGVLVVSGSVALWHVFGFAAVTGIINSVENPARQSFVSELVGRDLLPNGVALMGVTFNTARIIGPAIAGVAVGWFGLGAVFIADAVLCTIPLVALAMMRADELVREAGARAASGGADRTGQARVVDGLRYVWRRSDLLIPIWLVLVIGMFGFNFQLTLAMIAKTEFHTGPGTFGLLTTALASGALAGAFASTVRRERPTLKVVLVAALSFGGFETLAGLAPTMITATVVLVPTGFFMVYFAQAANQRVQLGTAPAYRGRVMALYVLVFLGTAPIGSPLVGWCSEHFGPRIGLWGGGLITLGATVAIGATHARRIGATVRLRLRARPHVCVILPGDRAEVTG